MKGAPKKQHARAQALFEKHKLPEALSLYRTICTRSPQDTQAWHMAGAIAGMLGENEYAIKCCEKLITLRPDLHGPHLNLANILLATGKHHEAFKQYQQALHISPNDPQTLTNLAKLYLAGGKINEAINCLQTAINSDPSHFEAYNSLGVTYRTAGDLEAAEKYLRQALKLKPDYIDAYCNLGAVLSDRLQPDAARNYYDMALQVDPENPFVLQNYGNLHQTLGDYEKAKGCYLKALEKNKNDPALLTFLASLYERCGDYDAAFDIIKPMIAAGNFTANTALIYATLCKKKNRHNEAIEQLENIISTPIDRDLKIDTGFSLGDMYDERGDYDKAFSYYQAANDLDNTHAASLDLSAYLSEIKDYFNVEKINRLKSSGNNSELPIFIVGMPRTGTSLVEQILSSHPNVCGGGERSDIINLISSMESSSGTDAHYPQLLDSINSGQLSEIADRYLDKIQALSSEKSRFTDKTPLQGIHLGFISLLLPGSRIIICNRDPLDTSLSIYFHRFNAYHSYASNLKSLGVFYRQYEKLIRHWISVLDLKILPVQYEDLVRNSEPEIRKIIEFCGLEWDPQCLSFHMNKRTVNTPSYDQVRKPMYSSSVERWKHYEKHLEPLVSALSNNHDAEP